MKKLELKKTTRPEAIESWTKTYSKSPAQLRAALDMLTRNPNNGYFGEYYAIARAVQQNYFAGDEVKAAARELELYCITHVLRGE